jgi:electron transfer flavoprotein alpha subunit
MNREILVIAEMSDGRPASLTHDVIAFARMLAGDDSAALCIMVPGGEIRAFAHDLAHETGLHVVALEGDGLDPYTAEAWMTAMTPRISARKPRYICIPHTSRGCDYAPALAVRLGAACITAVEDLRRQDGMVSFARSSLNGKIRMWLTPQSSMTVLTVLPGACAWMKTCFERHDASPAPGMTDGGLSRTGQQAGHVEVLKAFERPERTRGLGVIAAEEIQGLDLATADVIVSAGRGVGDADNLKWILRLAALFPKSAVGCSRPVCDLGWLGYKHQVGLTGRTVTPKLYFACGISGAVQHIAGMRNSRFIVAVNKDPRAAIFQVADVGIVEDLNTFLPLLIEKATHRASSHQQRPVY